MFEEVLEFLKKPLSPMHIVIIIVVALIIIYLYNARTTMFPKKTSPTSAPDAQQLLDQTATAGAVVDGPDDDATETQ
jgi:hypothetical protein